MTAPTANGHAPPATGNITRTPSFAPISPGIKEGVGAVAMQLCEMEKLIENINLQSATSANHSPTMGDLQQEINLLNRDIEETKVVQNKKIDGIRNNVKNEVKDHIAGAMQVEIEKKIRESIEMQVQLLVGEWGVSNGAKRFVEDLKTLAEDNHLICGDAQIKLDNSRARHENSTLDEHADFETELAKIKLPDGNVSKAFPRTLKVLFSYDEKQLLQLFHEYELPRLETHLENLNRFLGYIGLRFSVPEQSLIFLDNPPAYTSPNVLESPKEKPAEDPSVPPNPIEERTEVKPGVQPEQEEPVLERTNTNNNPAQLQAQEEPQAEQHMNPEKHVQRDPVGQRQAEIELSTIGPQRPTVTTHYRTQQTIPIHSPWSANPAPSTPTHPQQSTAGNPPGGKGVGGWFKSVGF